MEQPFGAGQAPNTGLAPRPAHPSLFGLAPCGVYPASVITAGAVRSYRTFSPLPDWPSRRTPFGPGCPCRSTRTRRYVFCGTSRPQALKPASRTLSGTLPCGVRTFLSRNRLTPVPAATARSSCQTLVYRGSRLWRVGFEVVEQAMPYQALEEMGVRQLLGCVKSATINPHPRIGSVSHFSPPLTGVLRNIGTPAWRYLDRAS